MSEAFAWAPPECCLPGFLGQLGMHIDERILEFVRDFGLLLFVYTVGLHVGPGFFSSVKQRGLQLNALGGAVVLLGGLIVAGFRFLFHFSLQWLGAYSPVPRPIHPAWRPPRLRCRPFRPITRFPAIILAWPMPSLIHSGSSE